MITKNETYNNILSNYTKEEPLVSVIIPCYNHEKYISDCLQGLFKQTYKNIELLIIDDCSPDNSFSIIESWKDNLISRFTRVEIIKNKINCGVVKNINKLIKMSKGEFIKVLASDDMLLPNAIEKLVNFAAESGADAVYSNAYLVDESYKYDVVYKDLKVLYEPSNQPSSGKGLTKKLCVENFICSPSSLIPKKTYENYGLYDEQFKFEDYEYWLRISVNGSIEYLNEITTLYRVSKESLSHFNNDQNGYKKQILFYLQLKEILKKYDSYYTKKELSGFFNINLTGALNSRNKEMISLVISDMRENRTRLSIKNIIKTMLVGLNFKPIIKRNSL